MWSESPATPNSNKYSLHTESYIRKCKEEFLRKEIIQKGKRSRSVQLICSHFQIYSWGGKTIVVFIWVLRLARLEQLYPHFPRVQVTKISFVCCLMFLSNYNPSVRPSANRNLIKRQTEVGLSCSLRCLSAGGNDTGNFPSSSVLWLSAPALGPSAIGFPTLSVWLLQTVKFRTQSLYTLQIWWVTQWKNFLFPYKLWLHIFSSRWIIRKEQSAVLYFIFKSWYFWWWND